MQEFKLCLVLLIIAACIAVPLYYLFIKPIPEQEPIPQKTKEELIQEDLENAYQYLASAKLRLSTMEHPIKEFIQSHMIEMMNRISDIEYGFRDPKYKTEVPEQWEFADTNSTSKIRQG